MNDAGTGRVAEDRSLLVVGTGLIGTSIGLAATQAGWQVQLLDPLEERVALAVSLGAGSAYGERPGAPALVVVAAPPGATAQVCVEALQQFSRATVTHVCSVQSGPAVEVEQLFGESSRFLGGHPIAGREVSGPAGADAALFRDRPWVICPTSSTGSLASGRVTSLALDCGALPVTMTAAEHDRVLATLSHTPQLVASALAASLADAAPEVAGLAGPGLRDTTRIADSDPAMWAAIAVANPLGLAAALRQVTIPLTELAEILDRGDVDEVTTTVTTLMRRGRAGRSLLPGKHGRTPVPMASAHVAVPDEPGALARLFADIATEGINVEDVRVEHVPGHQAGLAELAVSPDALEPLLTGLRSRGWTAVAGAGEAL